MSRSWLGCYQGIPRSEAFRKRVSRGESTTACPCARPEHIHWDIGSTQKYESARSSPCLRVRDGRILRACRTRRSRHLGNDPALMLRADTNAPVFNDEEKRARATTQVHEVARESYRFDVGGLTFWAGCDRATTLVAWVRHVGSASFPARNVPAETQRFAPSYWA